MVDREKYRTACLIILLMGLATSAVAQLPGPPVNPPPLAIAGDRLGAINADASDIQKKYLVPGRRPLDTTLPPPGPSAEATSFAIDLAYNLKAYHIGHNVGVSCEDHTAAVRGITLDGAHVPEITRRATVYYVAQTSDPACPTLSEVLTLERLADGDWYAPVWGVRLVHR